MALRQVHIHTHIQKNGFKFAQQIQKLTQNGSETEM